MTARSAMLVTASLAVGACGGASAAPHTGRRTVTAVSPRGEPAAAPRLPRMRALLAAYSPSGYDIVTAFERLPRTWKMGNSTVTLSYGQGFADYFDDEDPANLVLHMGIAVHEVYHGYASVMVYQLLADTGGSPGGGAEAVLVADAPLLVTYTPTYPAREMDASFPANARTHRYRTYITETADNQSTQVDGVYGLLDEWAAYFHTARTKLDFWPWVRDEAPRQRQLIVDYVSGVHEIWVPYAELKLFILHYLAHARGHHPELYRQIVDNDSFRAAFVAIDDAYRSLLAEAAALEPTLHAFAREHDIDAALVDGRLMYYGQPSQIRDAAYPEVVRLLDSATYREVEAALRSGAKGAGR